MDFTLPGSSMPSFYWNIALYRLGSDHKFCTHFRHIPFLLASSTLVCNWFSILVGGSYPNLIYMSCSRSPYSSILVAFVSDWFTKQSGHHFVSAISFPSSASPLGKSITPALLSLAAVSISSLSIPIDSRTCRPIMGVSILPSTIFKDIFRNLRVELCLMMTCSFTKICLVHATHFFPSMRLHSWGRCKEVNLTSGFSVHISEKGDGGRGLVSNPWSVLTSACTLPSTKMALKRAEC